MKKYTVTLNLSDGRVDKVVTKDMGEARDLARRVLEEDPKAAVNILTVIMDDSIPISKRVCLERHERRDGEIKKIDY